MHASSWPQVFGLPDNPSKRGKLWTFLSVFKASKASSAQFQLPAALHTCVGGAAPQWERRKGWDVLLKAYLTEFTFKDHVRHHSPPTRPPVLLA